MIGVVIREAKLEDLPEAARLWRELVGFHQGLGIPMAAPEDAEQLWLASFSRGLGRFSFLWVAERDRRLVGYLLARLKTAPPFLGGAPVGEVSSVAVTAEARDDGIGERLVRAACDRLVAEGARAVEVQVYEANPRGQAFWRRLGFSPELRQLRWTPPGDDGDGDQ